MLLALIIRQQNFQNVTEVGWHTEQFTVCCH